MFGNYFLIQNKVNSFASLLFLFSHPPVVIFNSLQEVLMLESKLYLIFEFLPMDLRKYMESLGDGKHLDSSMVKSLTYQVIYVILITITIQDVFVFYYVLR